MGKRTTSSNHSFMTGSFVMMILVFIIVFIFLMWAFKINDKKDDIKYKETYQITLGESTLNEPLRLFVNDSLIFSGTPTSVMTLSFTRFEEKSTMLIVDQKTDQLSLVELSDESEKINLEKVDNEFFVKPKD